jgi:CO dehydrogenase maturation factor
MKIAVTGKGGVGKTLISSFLAKMFAENNYSVIAIDADPDANLATMLGFTNADKIVPISMMKELIAERTETKLTSSGQLFKMNPRVDDVPEKYSLNQNRIKLMIMGEIKRAGSGCYCPENSFLNALLAHLLLARDEIVIMDMSAGTEHLSRGTARAVDILIIVVEPSRASIETAKRISQSAKELSIKRVVVVANKVRKGSEKSYISSCLSNMEILGYIPFDSALTDADIGGRPVMGSSQIIINNVRRMHAKLLSSISTKD